MCEKTMAEQQSWAFRVLQGYWLRCGEHQFTDEFIDLANNRLKHCGHLSLGKGDLYGSIYVGPNGESGDKFWEWYNAHEWENDSQHNYRHRTSFARPSRVCHCCPHLDERLAAEDRADEGGELDVERVENVVLGDNAVCRSRREAVNNKVVLQRLSDYLLQLLRPNTSCK